MPKSAPSGLLLTTWTRSSSLVSGTSIEENFHRGVSSADGESALNSCDLEVLNFFQVILERKEKSIPLGHFIDAF